MITVAGLYDQPGDHGRTPNAASARYPETLRQIMGSYAAARTSHSNAIVSIFALEIGL